MSSEMSGRTALVTGGASGIGRAVTEAYLDRGAWVTVLERSASHAEALRTAHVDGLTVIVGDATAEGDLLSALDSATADDGGLDNLTCCVGTFDNYVKVHELSPSELSAAAEEIWRFNVLSALTAVTVCYDALRRARGSVTLTLSESAFHPVGGGVLYGSSKWALRGVVAHLAKELAPEVRVNAVAPGGTTGTRFGGLASLGQTQRADTVAGRDERIAAGTLLGVTPRPEDHAAAFAYLADPVAARVVTGAVITSDGGRG